MFVGKRQRRGQVFQPATRAVGGPLGAIAVQKALRNGKQELAIQKAKSGAPKEEVKDVIWEIAMTPAQRLRLQNNLGKNYSDLDEAIDDLASDLLKKHGPKTPAGSPGDDDTQ